MLQQGLLKRKRLITERQEEMLERLRGLLQQLVETLERFGANTNPGDLRTLTETLEHLDELFLLVIAGEFNSGKSSFINALLGSQVLAEGVTPTTDRITLLRYGDEAEAIVREDEIREQMYPAEVLHQLTIVDTPGTNAVIRHHEELTRTFIPRADLVLFATSADRPFTESERAFLSLIKEWGKKVVMIVNKIDILDEEEREQVVDFVHQNAGNLLGVTPDIFPVSARLARRARTEDDTELRERSRMDAIERYVVETLDEETRVRLKLLSPLGVAERVIRNYLSAAEHRLETLKDDFATLDNIEQQLGYFREDLHTDAAYHLNELDAILRELEERGIKFIDENVRLGRITHLLQSEKLRDEFEQYVVGDVAEQIDVRVQKMVDAMIEKDLRLWQSIVDYVNRRRAPQYSQQIIGQIGGAFDYNRGALLESIGNTATTVVSSYDKRYESEQFVEEVRSSVAATAIAQVGAVGLGTALVLLLKSAIFDVTGILAASLVAIGGFYLLPAKRRQAKRALSERIEQMREQLRETVTQQVDRELDESIARIREAVAPYTRFVRSQREQLTEIQQRLSDHEVACERLRHEIA